MCKSCASCNNLCKCEIKSYFIDAFEALKQTDQINKSLDNIMLNDALIVIHTKINEAIKKGSKSVGISIHHKSMKNILEFLTQKGYTITPSAISFGIIYVSWENPNNILSVK